MAIEIKQRIGLNQQLVITPQLQQAIRLLQLSRMELNTLIQSEILENPVLEDVEEADDELEEEEAKCTEAEKHEQAKIEDKDHEHVIDEIGNRDGLLKEPADFDWESYIGAYNAPEYAGDREAPEEVQTYENVLRQTESLHEHLLWQLHLSGFPEDEVVIGTEIIGNINDDGYLQGALEDIAVKCQIPLDKVKSVLIKIQEFDPTGVAARDLKECLMLQARQFGDSAPLLNKMILDHLDDLEGRRYNNIADKMNLSLERVMELAKMIKELDPKPGRPYGGEAPQYIIPDVYVQKVGDDYEIILNEDGLPKLKISNFYRRSLMKGSTVAAPTKAYIQDRLKAALWLIKSIHQRQRTLYRVAQSIVKFQKDFFNKGVAYLKPLVLRDVAEDIEMHESTVSRVTTNKYMHSPRGIFELKFFFNTGIHQLEGGGIAAEAVKLKLQKLIEDEDPKDPLSDQKIAEILKQHNIDIARRTVAKYRETLGMPTSSKRRRAS